MSALLVAELWPHLTAPQGDVGNGIALRQRGRARGDDVEFVQVEANDPAPEAAIYLLGGTEELAQGELAARLRSSDVLTGAVRDGAVVLAVGAGFQVLGEWFDGIDGEKHAGVGLLDVRTTQPEGGDTHGGAQGPVVTHPVDRHDLPALYGFESHSGRTELGAGVECFAHLQLGSGNAENAVDGAVTGRVIGTYLHGPLLTRNPEVADLLLGWALDRDLEPLPPGLAEQTRAQRIAEDLVDPTGWGGQVVAH